MVLYQQYSHETFLDRVYRKSKSKKSRRTAEASLAKFDKYCFETYKRSSEQIISKIKNSDLVLYRVLDDFISFWSVMVL